MYIPWDSPAMYSLVNGTLAGLNDITDWSQPTNPSVGEKFKIATTALIQKCPLNYGYTDSKNVRNYE